MDFTQVILVDESDNATGTCEKMRAHADGLLHRAFSVFIFNGKGEMLLQQRAMDKYHSGGLWTNACCSHPAPGEETAAAALRRLKEEMGFTAPVEKIFDFVYRADFDNGLTEYEFDHVLAGYYDGDIHFNNAEVMDYRYMDMGSIHNLLKSNPEQFTAWFRIAFKMVADWKAGIVQSN
ncbi:MAG: isopentenyl-diphosphate Delta-isomerase [Chitinophagaceae bacterium]|nr:isopentenyl-diphosphate Delta-isomerase [Chitinophagaceae bacterium]MBK8953245.1 isopentenyl-diphosphate Delta-isomerase [Chitinophagaceae bacterium]